MRHLRRRPPHAAISATDYNALVDAVEDLHERIPAPQHWPITGSFPIEVRRHPGGVHLSLAYTDRDAGSIRAALHALLDDPARRKALGDAGYARSQEFTWETSAEAHLSSYQRAADQAL